MGFQIHLIKGKNLDFGRCVRSFLFICQEGITPFVMVVSTMKPWNQNSQVKLGKNIQNNCICIILQKIYETITLCTKLFAFRLWSRISMIPNHWRMAWQVSKSSCYMYLYSFRLNYKFCWNGNYILKSVNEILCEQKSWKKGPFSSWIYLSQIAKLYNVSLFHACTLFPDPQTTALSDNSSTLWSCIFIYMVQELGTICDLL